MIKKFSEFRNRVTPGPDDQPELNEGIGDWLGQTFGSIWGGAKDLLTKKITAHLLSKLGIEENSIFAELVSKFVQQIPISDYYGILFNSKLNAKYLAPKMAEAAMEFISGQGYDGIAQSLGFNRDGLIYQLLRETFTNEAAKLNFKKNLENFFLSVFQGFPSTSATEFEKSLTSSEKSALTRPLLQTAKDKGIKMDKSARGEGNILTNFLTNMQNANQANSAQIASSSTTYNQGLTAQQYEDLIKFRS
jgi:hypothetical protein